LLEIKKGVFVYNCYFLHFRSTLVSFINSSAAEQLACLHDWVSEVGTIAVGSRTLVSVVAMVTTDNPENKPHNCINQLSQVSYS
jgi:hypothetical protein